MVSTSSMSSGEDPFDMVVRGLKAVDVNNIRNIVMLKKASSFAFILGFFAYSYALQNIFVVAFTLLNASIFIVTQFYVTLRLVKYGKFSIKEMLFLYRHQSLFIKFVILVMFFALGSLSLEVVVLQQSWQALAVKFIGSFVLIGYVFSYLTSPIVDTIVTFRMKTNVPVPFDNGSEPVQSDTKMTTEENEHIVDDSEEDTAKTGTEYEVVAKEVLKNLGISQTATSESVSSMQEQETSLEEKRYEAIQKLKQLDGGSFSSSLALGPEEIDALTDEELEALFEYNGEEL